MKSKKKTASTKKASEQLAELAVLAAQEKKASNIVVMDLREVPGSVSDFFVVCQGSSRTQVEAIANSVDDVIKKELGEDPWHVEGYTNAEWILMDYVNVVVHVFQEEARDFYRLEKLWADAQFRYIDTI